MLSRPPRNHFGVRIPPPPRPWKPRCAAVSPDQLLVPPTKGLQLEQWSAAPAAHLPAPQEAPFAPPPELGQVLVPTRVRAKAAAFVPQQAALAPSSREHRRPTEPHRAPNQVPDYALTALPRNPAGETCPAAAPTRKASPPDSVHARTKPLLNARRRLPRLAVLLRPLVPPVALSRSRNHSPQDHFPIAAVLLQGEAARPGRHSVLLELAPPPEVPGHQRAPVLRASVPAPKARVPSKGRVQKDRVPREAVPAGRHAQARPQATANSPRGHRVREDSHRDQPLQDDQVPAERDRILPVAAAHLGHRPVGRPQAEGRHRAEDPHSPALLTVDLQQPAGRHQEDHLPADQPARALATILLARSLAVQVTSRPELPGHLRVEALPPAPGLVREDPRPALVAPSPVSDRSPEADHPRNLRSDLNDRPKYRFHNWFTRSR